MVGTRSSGCLRHSGRRAYYRASYGTNFRQAEVQNLGVAALRHEDIGGLDVAVNNPFVVRSIKRIGDLNSYSQQEFRFKRTA